MMASSNKYEMTQETRNDFISFLFCFKGNFYYYFLFDFALSPTNHIAKETKPLFGSGFSTAKKILKSFQLSACIFNSDFKVDMINIAYLKTIKIIIDKLRRSDGITVLIITNHYKIKIGVHSSIFLHKNSNKSI